MAVMKQIDHTFSVNFNFFYLLLTCLLIIMKSAIFAVSFYNDTRDNKEMKWHMFLVLLCRLHSKIVAPLQLKRHWSRKKRRKIIILLKGSKNALHWWSKYTFLSFIDSFTGTNEVSAVRGNCLNCLDNCQDHFLHLSSQYYEKAQALGLVLITSLTASSW